MPDWLWQGALLIGISSSVPFVLWASLTLRTNNLQLTRLVQMHEHPENTGFGTVGMTEVIKANTTAIRELSHYVQWQTEQTSGKKPPPFVDTPT